MANEFVTQYTTGSTLYTVRFDAVGQVFNKDTGLYEAFNGANWAHYAVPQTESGTSGFYFGSMGAGSPAGLYEIVMYAQVGGTPALTDTFLGSRPFEWDGTAAVPLASRLAAASYTPPPSATVVADAAATAILADPSTPLANDANGHVGLNFNSITQATAPTTLANITVPNVTNVVASNSVVLAADGLDAVMVEDGINARQALSPILAAAAGAVSGSVPGGGTVTLKNPAGTAARISAVVDANGNRNVITLNLPT